MRRQHILLLVAGAALCVVSLALSAHPFSESRRLKALDNSVSNESTGIANSRQSRLMENAIRPDSSASNGNSNYSETVIDPLERYLADADPARAAAYAGSFLDHEGRFHILYVGDDIPDNFEPNTGVPRKVKYSRAELWELRASLKPYLQSGEITAMWFSTSDNSLSITVPKRTSDEILHHIIDRDRGDAIRINRSDEIARTT